MPDDGLHVLGTISDDLEIPNLKRFIDWYPELNIVKDPEGGELCWKRVENKEYRWKTLFLFHNLLPYELLACYLSFTDKAAEPWQIPMCYLPCSFETHKARVVTLICHTQNDIIDSLKNNPKRYAAMQASMNALSE